MVYLSTILKKNIFPVVSKHKLVQVISRIYTVFFIVDYAEEKVKHRCSLVHRPQPSTSQHLIRVYTDIYAK